MEKLTIYSDGNLNSTFITVNNVLIDNLNEILISITQKIAIIRISILDDGDIVILNSFSEILHYYSNNDIIDSKDFEYLEKLEITSLNNEGQIEVILNETNLSDLVKLYIHLKTEEQDERNDEIISLLNGLEIFTSYYECLGFNNKKLLKNIFPTN